MDEQNFLEMLVQQWKGNVFDVEDLIKNNITCFLTISEQKFSAEHLTAQMVPQFVATFVDLKLPIEEHVIDIVDIIASIVTLLKQAQHDTICYNDYTVLDMGAVETNNSNKSKAKSVLIGTPQSLSNAHQWHVINNTHTMFEELFIPVYVPPSIMAEDDFFVLKHFEPDENLRLFKVDLINNHLRIAVSPHIKARVRRVRKMMISQVQQQFYIDHRYTESKNDTK